MLKPNREIAKTVLECSVRLCNNNYDNTQFKLIIPAPNEVLYHKSTDGRHYFVIDGTKWDQAEDRDANYNTAPEMRENTKFYAGYIAKADKIIKKIKKFIASKSSKINIGGNDIIFGGFSQGAAIAQLIALDYAGKYPAYCFASPGVIIGKPNLFLNRTFIINNFYDPIRYYPQMRASYVGKEYFITNNGIKELNIFRKLIKMSKVSQFSSDIHSPDYYLNCLIQNKEIIK